MAFQSRESRERWKNNSALFYQSWAVLLGGTFPTVCKKLPAGARAVCRSPEPLPSLCSTSQTPLMLWRYPQLCSPGEVSAQHHFFPSECFKKQSSLWLTDISLCQTVFNGSLHILGSLHFLYHPRRCIFRSVWCYPTEISHSRGKGKEYFACPCPGEITATSPGDLFSWIANSKL